MVSFSFRETRLESQLPVWLRLQANGSQELHPGKVEATIINVSKGGACLLIPKLLIDGKHLFFTTLNSSHTLLLQPHGSLNEIDEFSISAKSVWMDSCEHLNQQFFKVGISFTTPQKDFFESIKKHLRSL